MILLVLSCSGSIVLVDSHKITLTYHTYVSLTIISFAMVIIGTKTMRDVNIQLPTTAQCRQGDCGGVLLVYLKVDMVRHETDVNV